MMGYYGETITKPKLDTSVINRFKLDALSFNKISIFIDNYYRSNYKYGTVVFYRMPLHHSLKSISYKNLRDDIKDIFGFSKLESSAIVHRYIRNKYKYKKKNVYLHW